MGSSTIRQIEPTYFGYIGSVKDALIIIQAVLDQKLSMVPRRPHDRERADLIQSGSIFVFTEESSGIKRWTDGVSWSPSRILGRFLVYRELDRQALNNIRGEVAKLSFADQQKVLKPNNRTRKSVDGAFAGTDIATLHNDSSSIATSTTTFRRSEESNDHGSTSVSNRSLFSSLMGSYTFKEPGLIKKTLSLTVRRDRRIDDPPGTKLKVGETYHLIAYYSAKDVERENLHRPSDSLDLKDLPISNGIYEAIKESSLSGKFPVDDDPFFKENTNLNGISTNFVYSKQEQLHSNSNQVSPNNSSPNHIPNQKLKLSNKGEQDSAQLNETSLNVTHEINQQQQNQSSSEFLQHQVPNFVSLPLRPSNTHQLISSSIAQPTQSTQINQDLATSSLNNSSFTANQLLSHPDHLQQGEFFNDLNSPLPFQPQSQLPPHLQHHPSQQYQQQPYLFQHQHYQHHQHHHQHHQDHPNLQQHRHSHPQQMKYYPNENFIYSQHLTSNFSGQHHEQEPLIQSNSHQGSITSPFTTNSFPINQFDNSKPVKASSPLKPNGSHSPLIAPLATVSNENPALTLNLITPRGDQSTKLQETLPPPNIHNHNHPSNVIEGSNSNAFHHILQAHPDSLHQINGVFPIHNQNQNHQNQNPIINNPNPNPNPNPNFHAVPSFIPHQNYSWALAPSTILPPGAIPHNGTIPYNGSIPHNGIIPHNGKLLSDEDTQVQFTPIYPHYHTLEQ